MYINLKQLSEKLNVHTNTVYRLVKEGMPHIKIGNEYRFDFDKVEKWLQEK